MVAHEKAPLAAHATAKREAAGRMGVRKTINKGAWTAEEDQKLAEIISVHGAKRWKVIAAKAGLARCGKSCRLRWLNYLRPNIKRGNISDQEEDLILRLHRLLGNRWSLIAGRLPGRTDNEIKNYWNSHLSKKITQKDQKDASSGETSKEEASDGVTIKRMTASEMAQENPFRIQRSNDESNNNNNNHHHTNNNINNSFHGDDFFDFSNEDPLTIEWMMMSELISIDEVATGIS